MSILSSSVKSSLLAFVVFGSMVSPAIAETIVDWGGNYVSTDTPFAGTLVTEGSGIHWRYSDTTPLVDAGTKFYGATSLYYNSGGTLVPSYDSGRYGVRNGSTADSLSFSTTNPATSGSALTIRGLIFVKKEDFLNGANNSVVTFDSESRLSMGASNGASTGRGVRLAVYALVGENWNWYLYETNYAGSMTATTLIDPTAKNWALYTPYDNDQQLSLNIAPTSAASYSINATAFEDIGAVGFYFNMPRDVEAADKAFGLSVTALKVDAQFTPVPEGSTIGMLLIGSGLLFTGLRFHQK